MPAVTGYLVNGVDGDGWQALSLSAQSAANCAAGWVVGTGSTNHGELAANTERASSVFTGTTVPDGSLDTSLKDALRFPDALSGSFASANWTLQFAVRSPTQGGAADGRIRFRLIKANADGSSATEITAGQQQASAVTNVTSSADSNSTLTFNPGAFTMDNQYLFIQIAWERTGAGGMSTTNIRLRTGSASTPTGTVITTSDFTPDVFGTLAVTLGAMTAAGTGTVEVKGTTAATLAGMTVSATASVVVAATAAVTLEALTIVPVTGFDIGINFRDTAGYVSDGSNETYCAADSYPTTRGGVTFGWLSAVSAADRNSGLDRRLAGINFNGAGPDEFQLDLPGSGLLEVHLALGDAAAAHVDNKVEVFDNTTSKFAIGPHTTNGTDTVYDADDVERTAAAWPSAEVGRQVTFESTTLKLRCTADANWTMMHLRVVGLDGSGGEVLVSGSLGSTLDAMTVSAAGTVAGGGGDINGALSTTLDTLTASAAAQVAVQGTTSTTLGAMSVAATATLAIAGQVEVTLGALTLSSTGTAAVQGSAAITLDATTVAGSGSILVQASGSPTFAALTTTAAGTVAIVASLSKTLDAMTLSGSGVVGEAPITGTLSVTLASMTSSAAAAVEVQAAAALSFAAMIASGQAQVSISASLTTTLGELTAAAAGGVEVRAAGVLTLSAMTAAGAGSVSVVGTGTLTFATITLSGFGSNGTVVAELKSVVTGLLFARTMTVVAPVPAELRRGVSQPIKTEVIGTFGEN